MSISLGTKRKSNDSRNEDNKRVCHNNVEPRNLCDLWRQDETGNVTEEDTNNAPVSSSHANAPQEQISTTSNIGATTTPESTTTYNRQTNRGNLMDANQRANIEEYIEGDWDHFYANESDIPFDENELADRLKKNTKPDNNLPTPWVLPDFLADKMKLEDATNKTGTPTRSRLILCPWNDDKELGVIRGELGEVAWKICASGAKTLTPYGRTDLWMSSGNIDTYIRTLSCISNPE